jgi:hypothetical protein
MQATQTRNLMSLCRVSAIASNKGVSIPHLLEDTAWHVEACHAVKKQHQHAAHPSIQTASLHEALQSMQC